jgi:hypothetical protein
MSFLVRFLKIYLCALLFSALGGLAFYWLVIKGNRLRDDLSYEEFVSAVRIGVGAWVGFITFVSFLLAVTGMKKTISVPVYDRNTFLYKINSAITKLRYRPQQQTENLLVFKPPALGLLAEKITIQLNPASAVITAPRGLLRKIQEKL